MYRLITQIEILGRRMTVNPVNCHPSIGSWMIVMTRLDGSEPTVIVGIPNGVRCSCDQGLADRDCHHVKALLAAGILTNPVPTPPPSQSFLGLFRRSPVDGVPVARLADPKYQITQKR